MSVYSKPSLTPTEVRVTMLLLAYKAQYKDYISQLSLQLGMAT